MIRMKIRNKILFYFSSAIIVLTAITLTIIYILFSEHREEEFQQLQNEKIRQTIDLIKEFKTIRAVEDNIEVHLIGFKEAYELENTNADKKNVFVEHSE